VPLFHKFVSLPGTETQLGLVQVEGSDGPDNLRYRGLAYLWNYETDEIESYHHGLSQGPWFDRPDQAELWVQQNYFHGRLVTHYNNAYSSLEAYQDFLAALPVEILPQADLERLNAAWQHLDKAGETLLGLAAPE
jgi:hypothetical protein